MSDKTYLVVGLGNIGAEYAATRHNAGFIILDAWAQASDMVFSTRRYGDVAELRDRGRLFVLLKPSTYMNLSGNAVRYWMQELDIPLEHVIVICDDINLPFGTVRMRQAGSDGGHNGLKHIAATLESQQYARIRIGVGHEFQEGGQIGFVLGELTAEQVTAFQAIAEKIAKGIRTWAFAGAQKAMTELNTAQKN
ncbi:MAG: aminoacyl-tRNA hydrolase [Bacteroidales bacterium]|nr:aminoacyl-tRNA hydrolase [Bacteroidales bacterium]